MRKIDSGNEVKLFLHKFIIDKLQDPKFKGISDKQKLAIRDGFCYTLALDWLMQPIQAQQYYFDKSLKNSSQVHLTIDQIVYFASLARMYEEYQNYITQHYSKRNKYQGHNDIKFDSIPLKELISIDNYFASKYYNVHFECNLTLNEERHVYEAFNPKNKKKANCCLFRCVSKSLTEDKYRFHTIAARLKVNDPLNINVFYFFDPQYGVYSVEDKVNNDGVYCPAKFLWNLLTCSESDYNYEFVSTTYSYQNYVFK